ncbi:MAG TPA: hypothetical protein PL064_08135, partial [Thermogutta sp.]|nr:hypothetical protein [Thermogutta sp.]
DDRSATPSYAALGNTHKYNRGGLEMHQTPARLRVPAAGLKVTSSTSRTAIRNAAPPIRRNTDDRGKQAGASFATTSGPVVHRIVMR